MDATIIIATHGNLKWERLAKERALPSAQKFGIPVIQYHGQKHLHEARNHAASLATSEWLCFLDADDELYDGYFAAMEQATGDLRAPSVMWIEDEMPAAPVSLQDRDIELTNPCVIGTLIRKEMFESVGGFSNWRAWEDWALFLSCYRKGAVIEHVPNAVYVAHVSSNSRNNTVKNPAQLWEDIKLASIND